MKTALQGFVEYLEGIKKRDNIPSGVITTAKNYLQIEKEQIMKANFDGWEQGVKNNQFPLSKEDYYNETFGIKDK